MQTSHAVLTVPRDAVASANCSPAGPNAKATPECDQVGAGELGTRWWPYISRRSTENPQRAHLVLRADGSLGYADEQEEDRDTEGGLWARISTDLSGGGTVENRLPHYYRQRRLMRDLLCQVCAQAPARDEEGAYLFVVADGPRTRADARPDWAEGAREATPPVCLIHAEESASHCPRLPRGVALWVHRPVLFGVFGIRYSVGARGIRAGRRAIAEYETASVARVVATQMIRRLDGVVVDWGLTEHLRSLHERGAAERCPARTRA
ncbi:hypothetical protein AB0N09_30745 [Streptomyces erythrochromogenes]|uniref:hypothetical protein n=1 Tax=Streptomyces erythrochromogenes TaxID=285574 RepID=UPI00344AD0EC